MAVKVRWCERSMSGSWIAWLACISILPTLVPNSNDWKPSDLAHRARLPLTSTQPPCHINAMLGLWADTVSLAPCKAGSRAWHALQDGLVHQEAQRVGGRQVPPAPPEVPQAGGQVGAVKVGLQTPLDRLRQLKMHLAELQGRRADMYSC